MHPPPTHDSISPNSLRDLTLGVPTTHVCVDTKETDQRHGVKSSNAAGNNFVQSEQSQASHLYLPYPCVYVCVCSCQNTPAGERVPCDGEVIGGLAAVDESMLTGESVLVPKGVGAAVAGGCIVFEGPLTIKASATGAESTLAGREGFVRKPRP